MKLRFRNLRFAAAAALCLGLSGCVLPTTPENVAQLEETNDPLEPTNRYLFEVNFFLDEFALKPLGWWYRTALPNPVQDSIRNALQNLRTPWIFLNDLMQGETDRAGTSAARFGINTTLGVLGLFDVASGMGYPVHEEDFGQTLAVWGVPEGPYLMIPILGPSNPRDAVGTVADSYLDPINLGLRIEDSDTQVPFARSAVTGIDLRSRNIETLDDLRRGSLDWYATVRSLYRQRRNSEIQNSTSTSPTPGLMSQTPWADEEAAADAPPAPRQ